MSVARNESRLVGASAVAFAVTLFVYVLLVDLPDLTTPPGDAIAFYQGSGHQAQAVVGGYVAALAAFLFVVFVVGMVQGLRRRGSSGTALAAGIGGTAFVALFLAAAAMFTSAAFTIALNNEPVAL